VAQPLLVVAGEERRRRPSTDDETDVTRGGCEEQSAFETRHLKLLLTGKDKSKAISSTQQGGRSNFTSIWMKKKYVSLSY
jgi:hypothetical protein